jgi:hypothetical protein
VDVWAAVRFLQEVALKGSCQWLISACMQPVALHQVYSIMHMHKNAGYNWRDSLVLHIAATMLLYNATPSLWCRPFCASPGMYGSHHCMRHMTHRQQQQQQGAVIP